MPTLSVEVSEILARRLEALATASGRSVQELAQECLGSFAGSFTSRRTILKARRDAALAAEAAYSLADLGWLQGYAGQGIDELLLFEGTEGLSPILATLEQAIQEKEKERGSRHTTGAERIVLSVMALNREVNNGGYDQFFRNSSRRFASSIVGNLARIGCPEIADITQRALDSLHLTGMSAAAFDAAMRAADPERDKTLQRCSVEFHEKSQVLETNLFAFVKKNQAAIQI